MEEEKNDEAAVTGTINERLMAELKEAADKEKYGAKSGAGKKLGLTGRPRKTPEEQGHSGSHDMEAVHQKDEIEATSTL